MKGLLLFSFSFFAYQLFAQPLNENSFARYTTENGLSHNNVNGIAQDSAGYMWIATAFGLNRFNGSQFVQFHSTSDPLSLAAEELVQMTWLDDHRLGLYTPAGLHIVNTRTGETRNLFIPYKRQNFLYKFNTITGAKADDKGNIYVLTRSGFYHFKDFNLVWRYDHYEEADLFNTHFHFGAKLLSLDTGRMLIISGSGMYQYEIEKKHFKKIQGHDVPLLANFVPDPSAYVFLEKKPGQFFVLKQNSDSIYYLNLPANNKVVSRIPFNPGATEFHYRTRMIPVNDSVFYITSHTSGFYEIRFYAHSGKVHFYPEKHFSSLLCKTILKDKDDQLWIATSKGLFRQDLQKSGVQFSNLPSAITDSFPNAQPLNVYVSAEKVYAGSLGEAGLLLFNKKTLAFEEQIIFDKNDGRNNQVNLLEAGRFR